MEYYELNPLIRGRELELISKETFEQMLQADSFDSLGELLKSTIYQSYIYEGFEEDFEANLSKEQSKLFKWLKEHSPEPEIVWIYTMRYTFHNLKILTKAEMTDQNFDYLYVDDGFYTLQVLKDAIHTQVSAELPENIMDCIREVHEYCAESSILQGIDVIYDRYFLTEQRRLGEKLGYPELLEEIIAFIDLTNITTTARGILEKRSLGFMTAVISSSGSIPKDTFLSFVRGDMSEYNQFLLSTVYNDLLKQVIHEDEIDLVKLEQLKDDYLSSFYQAAQTQAFGPLPLLAFLNAKEVESKNLRLLIIGKRNDFSISQLKERMRQVYDV